MSEVTAEQLEQIEAMFVQCAHGMTTTDSSVTLHGQAHSTLFFAIVRKGSWAICIPTSS